MTSNKKRLLIVGGVAGGASCAARARRGELLLDVRNVGEFEAGHMEGAVNIPLPELRDRIDELDPDQPIWVYCQVGQHAYYATRVLRLNGFNAFNLSGEFQTYRGIEDSGFGR